MACAALLGWGCGQTVAGPSDAGTTGRDAGPTFNFPRDNAGNFILPDGGLSAELYPDGGVPSGESCEDPRPLAVAVDAPLVLEQHSQGRVHNVDGPSACRSSIGPKRDVIYKVQVPPGYKLVTRYASDAGSVDCLATHPVCPPVAIGGCTCGDPDSLDYERAFPDGGTGFVLIWTDVEKPYRVELELAPQ